MYKVSYKSGNSKFVSDGTPLGVISLQQALKICEELWNEINGKGKYFTEEEKGFKGGIFAYTPDPGSTTGKLGTIKFTDGIIFGDFDGVPRQIVDEILERFDDIAAICSPLLGIKTSSKYAEDPAIRTECGFHVFFLSDQLSGDNIEDEYKEKAVTALALFCHCVKKVTGHDLSRQADHHNTNIEQRLYLNPAKCRYNSLARPLTENTIKKEDLTKLKANYPDIFEELRYLNNKKKNDIRCNVGEIVSEFTGNCTLDIIDTQRTDKFGDDDRYKVINFLVYHKYDHNDIVKWICDKRGRFDIAFKREIKGQCVYAERAVQKATQRDINRWAQIAESWGFFIKLKDKNSIEIPENEYLSYYKDLIINKFEKYNRLLIQAPTGTGKTTLMKELTKMFGKRGEQIVILVPFNSMLRLYEDCCVIVGSGYDGEFTDERPVCMVWDRAMRYDLSNRIVISDETHQWFFDRQYRNAAVKTINQAKKWNKIICISATPAGEEEELNLHRSKFTKKRNIIRTSFVSSKNSGGFIKNLLDDRDLNTNYVVFSDRHAMKLYQNFPEGCLLHSEKRNTQEFKNVIKDEKLSNSITFCTALAYNGLNFRNTSDYKVIIDVKEGEDTANKIIQAVGRLRNANIVEVIIVFTKNNDSSKRSVSEKVIDNNIIKVFNESNNGYSVLDFDERYTEQDSIEALTTIEKYLISHSSKENIIRDLRNEGYFSIQEYYDVEKHEKVNYVERDKSNVELKSILLEKGGCIDNIEYDGLDDYQKKWIRKMNKINTIVNVDWVRFINGRKMDSLLDTLFNEVRLIYEVCRLTKEEFEFYYSDDKLNEISNLKDSDGNKISAIGYKIVKKRFALARKIREMYELVDTYEVDPMEKVLDAFMGIKESDRIKSIKLKSEAGKKGNTKGKSEGGKVGKSITIQDNKGKIFHFDTYDECRMKKLDNCSTATFSKFLKGTSKYNKKYTVINA